jgi:anti-sigma factor RsiW
MSCSPFDVRDYFLDELPNPRRLEVEAHVQHCQACREELDRLRLTRTALMTLGEEEMPRRIGFVSDQVFEPSPWRRGWAALWGSGARLGFASAAMLSVAILVSALMRPAPAPVTGTAAVVRDVRRDAHNAVTRDAVSREALNLGASASDAVTIEEVDRRIRAAVSESEARQSRKTEQLVKQIEDRGRRRLEALRLAAAQEVDYYQRNERVLAANYGAPPREEGVSK